ncbi:hypothetical protein [Paraburkholderia atlantica]|uniref:Uncharacterized protein n=1 Tax=Paraburkholderia atlantica TaxID=2654982 RepID=D5WNH3_PARAM|nr:hypothetical protein [Paraburkholderia atlantica]ADG20852.1 hypothetical protein BC1002_7102 [Paraburkholderia atlantica]MBB5510934.1 hypothetical protein [Paraburkholderia atlantica]
MPTTAYSEPGKLVLSLFDELINRIKSSRPMRTNGKPLTQGFVYSQLVLGMPCDPRDYMNTWSPSAGGTIQDAKNNQPDITTASANGGGGTAVAVDPKLQQSINATWKTSRLVDQMLVVTDDDSYQEYPTARHVSFSYEGIINGMQAKPMPPLAPDVQKQIDDATKVLYELDPDDGSIVGKTKLYKNYMRNAEAYAQAKTDFTIAQNTALTDPTLAHSWPLLSASYKQKVDDAYDTFKTEGADKVERALDIIESVGISMQDHMIAKARKTFDLWNLAGLSGVADTTPYAYISPTAWADPLADDDGWQKLTVTSQQYNSHNEFHSANFVDSHFHSDSSSNSASAGASYFGFGAYASGGNSSADVSATYKAQSGTSYQFHNDAKNLTITVDYALCTINRPYFIGDLFYMNDWYLVGNKAKAISDGTVEGMLGDKTPHLMPMIPVQFLVIRNVKISAKAEDWGGDGATLHQMYTDSQSNSSSWNAGGGGGFSIGFLTIGGGGSHSETHADASFSSREKDDSDNNFGWSFDGQTLEVRGAQIVAWLNEIVPASAPLDAPAN